MNIRITGKNIEVTEAIKDYVEKKLKRMDKYFEIEQNATVSISTEKSNQVVEIQINCKETVYRAESKEADLYASIDKAIDILEGQVRKTKAKNDKKQKSDSLKDIILQSVVKKDEVKGEIIKQNYYEIKPITVEDARLELESKPQSQFLVFVNSDTKEVNVLFRTKDGNNYGIIEPEA